jgi:hypothetical protein
VDPFQGHSCFLSQSPRYFQLLQGTARFGNGIDNMKSVPNHARAWQSYNGSWPTRNRDERKSWSSIA